MPEKGIQTNRRSFVKSTAAGGAILGLSGCLGGDEPDHDFPEPEDDIEYEELGEVELMTVGRDTEPTDYEQSELTVQMWDELGLDVSLDVVDWGLHAEKREDLEFDIFIVAWAGTMERLYPYYNLYHSFHSEFAYPGGGNFMQWDEAEHQYDESVEDFFQTMDREEGQGWAQYCQAVIAENVPVIPLTHRDELALANTNHFENYTEVAGTNPHWNVLPFEDLDNTGETDTLTYAHQSEFRGFPNIMDVDGAVDWYSQTFHYDTLVRLDESGDPVSGAAEDWEVIDDTTVEVTLRDGMTFHDGEDVTAEDVQFTWEYMTEWGVPYLNSDIEPYENSEVIDDQTIEFNLEDPFGGFIQVSFARVPILPEHVWDDVTDEEDLEHPADWADPDTTGSGPFELVTYDHDERIIWDVNDDHYLGGNFNFDEMVYDMFSDLSTCAEEVSAGRATMTDGLTPTIWEQHDDNIHSASQAGISTDAFFFNTTNEPWMDVNVRKALAYAIDFNQIIDVVFGGEATNATSPISPVNEFYHNPDLNEYNLDIERSVDLLAESGFRWDVDGDILKPVDWEPHTTYIEVDNEWA